MNELDVKRMHARIARAKFLSTTPLINIPRPLLAMNRRRNLYIAQLTCGNLRSSSKFAIAI